jgi:hypothetical protein
MLRVWMLSSCVASYRPVSHVTNVSDWFVSSLISEHILLLFVFDFGHNIATTTFRFIKRARFDSCTILHEDILKINGLEIFSQDTHNSRAMSFYPYVWVTTIGISGLMSSCGCEADGSDAWLPG